MKFLPKIFASIIFSSLNYLREKKSTLSMFNPKPYNIFYFRDLPHETCCPVWEHVWVSHCPASCQHSVT